MTNYPKADLLIEAISSHFLNFRNLNARRIVGIGFLCDWKHCIEFGVPITECNWLIAENWIESQEFSFALFTHKCLSFPELKDSASPSISADAAYPYVSGSSEDTVCKHVFTALEKRTDFDFDKIILSTYPFNITGAVDIVSLSKEYRHKYGSEYTPKLRA
ncbi:hypothetical protein [Roseibium sp.]|uniref:hypothetical protein n=1 Tax=Roseibium sp. TaxID=1936156 RepID=UPI003BABA3CC